MRANPESWLPATPQMAVFQAFEQLAEGKRRRRIRKMHLRPSRTFRSRIR